MSDPRRRPGTVAECPRFRNNRLFIGYDSSQRSLFFGVLSSEEEIQKHKDDPLKCFRVWLSDGTGPPHGEAPGGISALKEEDPNITKLAGTVDWKTLKDADRTWRYAKLLRDIDRQKVRVRKGDQDSTFAKVERFFPEALVATVNEGPRCNGPDTGEKRPGDEEDDSTSQQPPVKQLKTGSDKAVGGEAQPSPASSSTAGGSPSRVDRRVSKLNRKIEHIQQHYVPGLRSDIGNILSHIQDDHGIQALDKPKPTARFAKEVVALLVKHIRACEMTAVNQKRVANSLDNYGVPSEIVKSASTTKGDIEKYVREVQKQIDEVGPMIAEVEDIAGEKSG